MKSTAATVAVAAAAQASTATSKNNSSADKFRIGFIGTGSRGFGAHVKTVTKLANEGEPIELVAVCDVYKVNVDQAAKHIEKNLKVAPTKYVDYREMLEKEDLDAVCIGTPDHWHHRQTLDALNKGLHVYCEKPMTKTVEEAVDVYQTWKKSGKVMQVGVQSTSLPVWKKANELLNEGKLGKVLMYQTEFFRNSAMGQWRYYRLDPEMTPKNIDWKLWLGSEEGLTDYVDFDREKYRQWRRFWPYGSGMFTDLFVHRTTSMLKATGLRFPGRVVGAGGLFVEYDGRQVPDVATVVADFKEGVQGLVTATMACQNTPIRQLIRGRFGSFVFGNGEEFDSFDYLPERPQVTRNSKLKDEKIRTDSIDNTTHAHFKNWIDAMVADDPAAVNNDPYLGAAAITTVILGAQSYRQGKVYYFDDDKMSYHEADDSWATGWEKISAERGKPNHIPGWTADDYGSVLEEPEHMKLAGPWIDGKAPENQ